MLLGRFRTVKQLHFTRIQAKNPVGTNAKYIIIDI
jgi:hypothetical protein